MRDWCDILEGLPRDAIQKACVRYLTDNGPRRPTPGDIVALARQAMPAPRIVRINAPVVEEKRERISPEAAAEIMRQAGFMPKRMSNDQG